MQHAVHTEMDQRYAAAFNMYPPGEPAGQTAGEPAGQTAEQSPVPEHNTPIQVNTQRSIPVQTTAAPPSASTIRQQYLQGSPSKGRGTGAKETTRASLDPRPGLAPGPDPGPTPNTLTLSAFSHAYHETVSDVHTFTPHIQLHWCETLLRASQTPSFVEHYTINAEPLPRTLTPAECERNAHIMQEHALKVLNKLARLECPGAHYLLGCLYSHRVALGQPVPWRLPRPQDIVARDDAAALRHYCAAARLGHGDAAYRAGASYEYCRGVSEAQPAEALRWYTVGASPPASMPACMYKVGLLEGSAAWLERAFQAGSSQAGQELGRLAEAEAEAQRSSAGGQWATAQAQREWATALQWYQAVGLRGYAPAQLRLGQAYERGECGLPVCARRSVAWYYTAAQGGSALAMLALAGWFLTGATGLFRGDRAVALEWAQRAWEVSGGRLERAGKLLQLLHKDSRAMQSGKVQGH